MYILFHGAESPWRTGCPSCHGIMLWGLHTVQCGKKGAAAFHSRWQLGLAQGICLQPLIYTAPWGIPGQDLIMISFLFCLLINSVCRAVMLKEGFDRTTSLPTPQPCLMTPRLVSITVAVLGAVLLPSASTPTPEFYRYTYGGKETEASLSKHSRQRKYLNPTVCVSHYFMDVSHTWKILIKSVMPQKS